MGLLVTCPSGGTCAGSLGVASHATRMAPSAAIASVSPMLELRLGLSPGHSVMVRAGEAPRCPSRGTTAASSPAPGAHHLPTPPPNLPREPSLGKGKELFIPNKWNQSKQKAPGLLLFITHPRV